MVEIYIWVSDEVGIDLGFLIFGFCVFYLGVFKLDGDMFEMSDLIAR